MLLLVVAIEKNDLLSAWPLSSARTEQNLGRPLRSSADAAGVMGTVPGLCLARCVLLRVTAGGP